MVENNTYLLGVGCKHFLEDAIELAAIGALKI
jgi:hypothetical protein